MARTSVHMSQKVGGSNPSFPTNITLSSNGRTAGFGPANRGSSP